MTTSDVLDNNRVRIHSNDFTFLCWNVEGVISKLNYPEFVSYVVRFPFVCLTESFIEYAPDNVFPNFDLYIAPAKRLSNKGRRSGGVLCLVRKEFRLFFEHIPCRYDNILIFKIKKSLLATSNDILLCCIYIPPVDSPYYNTVEEPDGITILETCMIEVCTQYTNCNILLCGDFNSRTGKYNTAISWDVHDVRSEAVVETRNSQDINLNEYGRSLLSLCGSFEMSILNGCENGTYSGEFTFLSPNGRSVIDYFIVSKNISHFCSNLKITNSVLSSHLALEMTIGCSITRTQREQGDLQQRRLIWNESLTEQYKENLQEALESTLTTLKQENAAVELDIDDVVSKITKGLLNSGTCMEKSFLRRKSIKKLPWFDGECYDSRRKVRRLLRVFKRSMLKEDRDEYFANKKAYKLLVKTKIANYQKTISTALCSYVNYPEMFWSQIRRLNFKYFATPNISKEDWYNYFKRNFQGTEPHDESMTEKRESDLYEVEENELNSEITEEEIKSAIDQLKLRKSPGSDQILAEMLKASAGFLVPYLCILFNLIFDSGTFPNVWQESIIVPIYKKGAHDDPSNYRGISLTSTLSKVFLHVLHCRLQERTEEYGLIGEEQAGFRRGYSTVDNIFTLHGIVERYLGRKKKMYVAFIDFCKAFDSVNRKVMFAILRRNGINGKMLCILQSMYRSARSCVRCPFGYTDYFECTSGLKQGCKCSPILFSYVVGEIAKEVARKGKHGIQLLPDIATVYLLLFADDVVLLSDTPVGLQNQLDNLKSSSESMGLNINMSKSKVMVFRLGGHLAAHERWHLGGEKLEVVNEYNYLGYKLSTKLSSSVALASLSMKGKTAVVQAMRPLKRLKCLSPNVIFQVFDVQIQPILLYGAEIWGASKCEEIEKIHLYMLKSFLNVPSRTPNLMIYGDTGRYPLYVQAILRCVKYWLRILGMDSKRYPKKVYEMMIHTNNSNDCWAKRIKNILCDYYFEDVWREQRVPCENAFLKELKHRLVCRYAECWSTALYTSRRYSFFRMFKYIHGFEQYLLDLDKPVFRNLYVQFRLGVSEICMHRYRYSETTTYLCPSCNESDEDEVHFLFLCPAYEDIRMKYLYFCYELTIQEGLMLCFTNYERERCRLVSSYLFHAFKRRSTVVTV